MITFLKASLTAISHGWLRNRSFPLATSLTVLEPTIIILLLSIVVATTACVIFIRTHKLGPFRLDVTSKMGTASNSRDVNKGRKDGEWTPTEFAYPDFKPCPLDLSEIKPIPYRPFRWGDYHVTMGIRSMPWEDWIELDNQFTTYHRIRSYRLHTCGSKVLRVLPATIGVVGSGRDAAIELVHELAEYLSRRYPSTFHIVRHDRETHPCDLKYNSGWSGAPPIKQINIIPLGLTYDLPLSADPEDDGGAAAHRALEVAALLVQDDLAVMIEGSDGRYYFQAGAICVGGFWRMQDKLGLPLDQIHLTGRIVPQYQEKLHTGLERFFKRLPVDKPVIRNNYSVQVVKPLSSRQIELGTEDQYEDIDPEELSWSTTANGPEDTHSHRHAKLDDSERLVPTPEMLRLRTERQTLRRLPRSGAVVFTIRTYMFGVEELGKERGVPGRMASAVRSWPDDVRRFRGDAIYRDVLLDYLDRCHKEQVEKGEVGEMEKLSSYPF